MGTATDSGIYVITNTVNGHRYIGSAIRMRRRWDTHRYELRRGDHHSVYLQRAYNRYGVGAFTFTVLEHIADPADLLLREQFYLDTLAPEYNMAEQAGRPLGRRISDETREKMRLAHLGKPGRKLSDEARARIAATLRGRKNGPHSAETRAKQSAAHKGRVFSDETRARISASKTGKKLPPRSPEHARKISEALQRRYHPTE